VFGRSYADALIERFRGDEAIQVTDALLLTLPSQLGADYNVHVLEAILNDATPADAGGNPA